MRIADVPFYEFSHNDDCYSTMRAGHRLESTWCDDIGGERLRLRLRKQLSSWLLPVLVDEGWMLVAKFSGPVSRRTF
jgi:hypothetical protein